MVSLSYLFTFSTIQYTFHIPYYVMDIKLPACSRNLGNSDSFPINEKEDSQKGEEQRENGGEKREMTERKRKGGRRRRGGKKTLKKTQFPNSWLRRP